MAMAGIEDRHRNLMVDSAPVATVVAAVTWACSSTVGRAPRSGCCRPVLLRDTIAGTGLGDPRNHLPFHRHSRVVEPWYRDTLAADRLAESILSSAVVSPADPGWAIGARRCRLQDPDCLRGFVSVAMVLSGQPTWPGRAC